MKTLATRMASPRLFGEASAALRRATLGLLLAAAGGCRAGSAASASAASATGETSLTVLPTGRVLRPAGRTIGVGNMPLAIAVAPGGRFATLLLSGWRERGLQIVDIHNGVVVQTLPQAGAFLGMTFSADGKWLYTSGAHRNVVYRYSWSGSRAALRDSLVLAAPDSTSDQSPFPAGLALSPDGSTLYVAENMADSLAVIDLATGRTVQKLATGHYPYGVVVSQSGDVFVSAWGGSTVSMFHSLGAQLLATGEITIGRHPSAMILNRTGTRLFATLSGTDRIAVVDTRNRTLLNTLADGVPDAPSEGSTPDALALTPDGRRLFVAEADNNAVAVFDLSVRDADSGTGLGALSTASALAGRMPALWYPSALALDGDSLLVVSAKGRGTAPNPLGPKDPRSYTLGQLDGTISVLPAQLSTSMLAILSSRVADANGWNAASIAHRRPPFTHVILVIKENRTYDQVLGDIPSGDGDTSLVFFPRSVSPNHHALAERFGLYDRFFTNAEVSAQGHPWTTSAYVTEYTEKTTPIGYANLRADESEIEADEPSTGFLWTSAARKGLSVRDYGESVKADTSSRGVRYLATRSDLVPFTNTAYPGFDLTISDQARANIWLKELKEYASSGTMPALELVYLPRDHTAGTRAGLCTPRACMADNDLALGRLVEGLSRTPFWKNTLVLVVEDDAQAGADHVDSHRSVMFAISAYSHSGTIHRFVNTTDAVATAEEVLGLAPLSQFDRYGRPLHEAWSATPDLRPYSAIVPTQRLDEVNPAHGVAAEESANIDLTGADKVDDMQFNHLLWHAIKGRTSPYPVAHRGSTLDFARDR